MAGPYKYDQAFFAPVSNVTTTADAELGSIRLDGGNQFVYVYNGGGADISTGRGAVLAGGVSGCTVTVSSISMVDVLFGVAKYNTITTGAYGWLLKKGFANIVMDTVGSATSGFPLTTGTNGRFRSVDSGTITGCVQIGRVSSAAASGDSGVGAYISVHKGSAR